MKNTFFPILSVHCKHMFLTGGMEVRYLPAYKASVYLGQFTNQGY